MDENDINKTVLEMEISRVMQSADIIAYAVNERSNEKMQPYTPKEYDGEAGKKLSALLNEWRTNANEWIKENNLENIVKKKKENNLENIVKLKKEIELENKDARDDNDER